MADFPFPPPGSLQSSIKIIEFSWSFFSTAFIILVALDD
jgi:hypothetical protein